MILPLFSLFCRKDEPIGKRGEKVAVEYLKKKGYTILEMNYKNPKGKQLGEIDIVAQKGKDIVFVEVKTRRGEPGKTFPEDNLTPRKLHKLEKIATYFLQSRHLENEPYRFDAVTVLFEPDDTTHIEHFEHIFA